MLISIEHLRELARITKTKINELTELERSLRTQIQTLEARQDLDVTASTDDAEIIDARVDAWGNTQGSVGTNIRNGQIRLEDAIQETGSGIQAQVQELSEQRLESVIESVNANERRRQEITQEEFYRLESDSSLQAQIQELAEACLRMSVRLAERSKE